MLIDIRKQRHIEQNTEFILYIIWEHEIINNPEQIKSKLRQIGEQHARNII